jgi:hypothetical protein
MQTQTIQTCCTSCGSSTHSVLQCWAEMIDEAPVVKIPVAAWKQGPPPSFGIVKLVETEVKPLETEVTKDITKDVAKDVAKKCEAAVENWLKTKKEEDDGWTLASRPKPKRCTNNRMIICQACTMPFEYTEQMKQKYESLGWVIPKVCKACSQQRFEAKKGSKKW